MTLDELVEKLEDLQSYGYGKNYVAMCYNGPTGFVFEDILTVEVGRCPPAAETVILK